MKLLSISILASCVNGRVLNTFPRDAAPLVVDLAVEGNTAARLSITNVGSQPLKIFKTGSILDDRDVERVEVSQAGHKVPYRGYRLYISPSQADDSAFEVIAPGQSIGRSWDVASNHDLSNGGTFSLYTAGSISYASPGSTDIAGTVSFQSNPVTTEVDGQRASSVHSAYQSRFKRQILQSGCTAAQTAAIEAAFPVCAARATAAAAAALGNTTKIKEYFKNDTPAIRSTVSGVFTKIAAECASTSAGFSKLHCNDVARNCAGGVIAYANPYPATNAYVVYCPSWFSVMPVKRKICHADDQPFVTMHELTHLTQIKGTSDYGTYGYAGTMRLSAAQNLNHADSYALFSNAIDVGGTC